MVMCFSSRTRSITRRKSRMTSIISHHSSLHSVLGRLFSSGYLHRILDRFPRTNQSSHRRTASSHCSASLQRSCPTSSQCYADTLRERSRWTSSNTTTIWNTRPRNIHRRRLGLSSDLSAESISFTSLDWTSPTVSVLLWIPPNVFLRFPRHNESFQREYDELEHQLKTDARLKEPYRIRWFILNDKKERARRRRRRKEYSAKVE